jgi:hypothetical protein
MSDGLAFHVTSGVLWQGLLLLSLLAAALLPVAARLAPRLRFAALERRLVAATFVVWLAIWSVMAVVYWRSVYSYVFPAWSRWLLPLFMATGFAAAGWALFRIARRFRRPAMAFVLLGGALGPLTHVWAVLRGIVSRPPVLRGASPVAAVLVSAPEFAIYFTVILGLACLSARVSAPGARRSRRGSRRAA